MNVAKIDALGRRHFLLDGDVAHLNHGSFGAVPRPVLAERLRWMQRIEASPERHYRADLSPALAQVRARVAAFLATDPNGLALVDNATAAMAVILAAVAPAAGSEIVLTDHAYPWVHAAAARTCASSGARLRVVPLPLTAAGSVDGDALADSLAAVTHTGTALVILDQITSSSALMLPLERVLAGVPEQVNVAIDGAHAPGLIAAPVPHRADFWFGNLHKWAFAARTAAALVVAPTWRDRVRPLIESAAAERGFPAAFDYLGTQDRAAFLSLPAALDFPPAQLGCDFAALRERNRRLLDAGLTALAERHGFTLGPDERLPMRTFSWGANGSPSDAARLADALRAAGVEVAITSIGGRLHARVSVQAYVSSTDFARLDAVAPLLRA
jgi:isopenicillin-N epimerase